MSGFKYRPFCRICSRPYFAHVATSAGRIPSTSGRGGAMSTSIHLTIIQRNIGAKATATNVEKNHETPRNEETVNASGTPCYEQTVRVHTSKIDITLLK